MTAARSGAPWRANDSWATASDLCVDEAARGQGVATALFHHVRRWAMAEGADQITLNVWCGNENAMHFYEKMGMKPRKIFMDLPLEDNKC